MRRMLWRACAPCTEGFEHTHARPMDHEGGVWLVQIPVVWVVREGGGAPWGSITGIPGRGTRPNRDTSTCHARHTPQTVIPTHPVSHECEFASLPLSKWQRRSEWNSFLGACFDI